MKFEQKRNGIVLKAKVKPNSGKFSLNLDGTIEVKSAPEGGKANREILKELKKIFKCNPRIVKGIKRREKEIFLEGVTIEEAENAGN